MFFDLQLGRYGDATPLGRVTMELKADVTPKDSRELQGTCRVQGGEGAALQANGEKACIQIDRGRPPGSAGGQRLQGLTLPPHYSQLHVSGNLPARRMCMRRCRCNAQNRSQPRFGIRKGRDHHGMAAGRRFYERQWNRYGCLLLLLSDANHHTHPVLDRSKK